MSTAIKRKREGRYKHLRNVIAGQKNWMTLKRLLPLMIALAIIIPSLAFMLFDKAPEEWVTENVTYVRTGTVELTWKRTRRNQALVTSDGRMFALTDVQAEAVLPKLNAGETCEITYEPNFVMHKMIRALSTQEDGVLIALEDSIADYKAGICEIWQLFGWLLLIALAAEIPIELFWLKKERARIAQVRGRIAKLEAREERKQAYHENKRAGA